MTAAAILSDALAIISPPSSWARGEVAIDRMGNATSPMRDSAKRFCMVGAVQRAGRGRDATDYGAAIRILRAACADQSIFEFNDGHGHKAVLSCMRRAIAAAGAA